MPTGDDLNRFLFQDFALEIERRKKLTVIGEHYYGAEQGRIITERPRVFDELFRLVTEEPAAMVHCPAISLVCDSISASKSKCGFIAFGLAEDLSGTGYATKSSDGCQRIGAWEDSATLSGTTGETHFLKQTIVYTGCTDAPSGEDTSGEATVVFDVSENPCEQPIIDGRGCAITGSLTDLIDSSAFPSSSSCDPPGRYKAIVTATLGVPYTTANLISSTEAVLPGYDDDFNDTCSAIRDLSDDETSYSIQRFKYKFTFASRTAYLKIFWTERFTPEGGGAPTDTAKTWTHVAGSPVTESDTYEAIEPDDDGVITIVNVRSSTSADCEPEITDECNPATDNCTGHYQNCQCQ